MEEKKMIQEEMNQLDRRVKERLAKIKHKLIVFSGKGGVGKSTVAANLGKALSQKGLKVGLLDVDIHGPNLAKILGVEGKRLTGDENGILPLNIGDNLKLISMSFFLPSSDSPVIWRGPLKMRAIQQFLGDVEWGMLDWLIIDSPPGTGDEPLSVAQLIPATYAIIVTTPQDISLLDCRKAVNFARRINLRILGIIENMSGIVCPYCGKTFYPFKQGGGERMALEMGVPFLGRIPMEPKIVEQSDEGRLEVGDAFREVAEKIVRDFPNLTPEVK